MAAILTSAVTTAGVVIAARALYVSRGLLKETIALRHLETDPQIAAYLELDKYNATTFDLVIRNIGRGPAYNVKSVFSPDIRYGQDAGGKRTTYAPYVQIGEGIKYLAPNQERRYQYGTQRHGVFDRGRVLVTLTITYLGRDHPPEKPEFYEAFILDFGEFGGMRAMRPDPEIDVPRSLVSIAESLRKIADQQETSLGTVFLRQVLERFRGNR